nr:12207_t:CDS:2 [Entrophospora candida]
MEFLRLFSLLLIVLHQRNELDLELTNTNANDDVELAMLILYRQSLQEEYNSLRRLRRIQVGNNYFATCMLMQDSEFKKQFRMSKQTYEWLCDELIPELQNNDNLNGVGAPGFPWKHKIMASIWFFSTGESFRCLGQRFGFCESTVCYFIRDVVKAINNKFLKEKIRFPRSENDFLNISNEFKKLAGFPGVFGAIDGSHIKIKAPSNFAIDYFNRKGYYSIVLQAIVDSNKKFIDIFVGFPGSSHDSRIFLNSPIYHQINNSINNLDGRYMIPSQFHLLGDGGYPNLNWILTPYRDNGSLTRQETYFNLCHSRTRIKVEQSFGLLKSRWRCLLTTFEVSIELVSLIISACCILHNICEERFENIDIGEIVPDNERVELISNNEGSNSGNVERNRIKNYLWLRRNNSLDDENSYF